MKPKYKFGAYQEPEPSPACECPKPPDGRAVYCNRHELWKGRATWSICQKSSKARAGLDKRKDNIVKTRQYGLGDVVWLLLEFFYIHDWLEYRRPFSATCQACQQRRSNWNKRKVYRWLTPVFDRISKTVSERNKILGPTYAHGNGRCGSCGGMDCNTSNPPAIREVPIAVDSRTYFDAVFVINLDRRSDRWEEFQRRYEEAGKPFGEVTRWSAVDGHKEKRRWYLFRTIPRWFKGGPGAWGCYQSHLEIFRHCLKNNIERVLILEDDAWFVEEAKQKADTYLSHIPDEWDSIYFGGQFLKVPNCRPVPLNQEVLWPYEVNRTHAHAYSLKHLPTVIAHLEDSKNWHRRNNYHVDHQLGVLHRQRKYNIYAPIRWIVGQDAGESDVKYPEANKTNRNLWEYRPPRLVMVLSCHRSGSSIFGKCLETLGVYFGHRDDLMGYEKESQVERREIHQMIQKAQPLPSTDIDLDGVEEVIRKSILQISNGGDTLGLKHPQLTPFLPQVREIATKLGYDLKTVAIVREIDDTMASMLRRPDMKRHSPADLFRHQQWLQRFAYNNAELKIHYEDLVEDPARELSRVCGYVGLSTENMAKAAGLIRPRTTQRGIDVHNSSQTPELLKVSGDSAS